MNVARRVRVTGRVQGVWFRAWTREQAVSLGVAGWVRNCEDGSVEAHLEGQQEDVDQLIERMRRGPSAARVDDAEIENAALEESSQFAVRE